MMLPSTLARATLLALTVVLAVPATLTAAAASQPHNAGHEVKDPAEFPNDMALCAANARGPAAHVVITGFKDRKGEMRVQLYSDRADEFLAKRRVLDARQALFRRVIDKVALSGPMSMCMPLPAPGRYSMIIFHDRDADGQVDILGDGAGLPGNPKLKFLRKPDVTMATFEVLSGVKVIPVTLNYTNSIFSAPRPVSNPQ